MAEKQHLADQFGHGLVVVSLLGGVSLFGWQVYVWLRSSIWISYSVVTALKWLNIPWATSPRDWIGLHQALDFLPPTILLPVLGIFIGVSIVVATND